MFDAVDTLCVLGLTFQQAHTQNPVDWKVIDRVLGRSEERRVGKECRSRWSPYH